MESETPTSQPRAWMPLVIRLITGNLLLYSGWLKLGNLNNFANTLDTMQLPVLSTNPAMLVLFAESFPWFELGLGTLLLSGLAARPAALVAGALFLTFTLLLATLRLQGFKGECGCLGPLLSSRIGWLHVGLDALVAGACFRIVFETTQKLKRTPNLKQ